MSEVWDRQRVCDDTGCYEVTTWSDGTITSRRDDWYMPAWMEDDEQAPAGERLRDMEGGG